MSYPESPRLRSTITGHVDPDDLRFVWLYDVARVSRQTMRVRREVVGILELFDGTQTLRDVQIALMRHTGGELFPFGILEELAGKLDEVLFLEGPRLQEHLADFLRSPVREPACIGSYESDPAALRGQLRQLFTADQGPGLPGERSPNSVERNGHGKCGELRAVLIPHIDFHRGGYSFAWGFKEVVENTDASLFVILGTSHYSNRRFILTRKDFRTPLGIARTDQDYINRIVRHYGDGLFDDEAAHLPEHSIEFHVVFLQYCLEGKRPFRIVPLLVGSFQDAVQSELPPHGQPDIACMIEALERAEADAGEKVCYLISGDLAHVGPKFGDRLPVDQAVLDLSRRQDHAMLERMEAGDREGLARVVFGEQDARRICGFPPTYIVMSVLQPDRGQLLLYDQYVEPRGFESVSFASVGFYKA